MTKNGSLYYYIGSSSASGAVKRGSISLVSLTIGVLLLVALFVFSVVGGYYVVGLGYYQVQLFQAKNRTDQLAASVATIDDTYVSTRDSLSYLFAQEDNIRLQYGLPLTSRDVRQSGIGGEPSLTSMTSHLLGLPSVQNVERYAQGFDKLSRQISLTKESIIAAHTYHDARSAYFIDLPSTWPVGGRITSPFGVRYHPVLGIRKMHDGLDLSNPRWTPIEAPANGVVTFQGRNGAYGNVVILKHLETGLETRYAHMVSAAVEKGQRVERGMVLGYVGNTGRSTGPHLHYEVRVAGQPVNPRNYLPDSLVVVE